MTTLLKVKLVNLTKNTFMPHFTFNIQFMSKYYTVEKDKVNRTLQELASIC